MDYRSDGLVTLIDGDLAVLHDDLSHAGFVPGWHRPGKSPIWPLPTGAYGVASWSYAEASSALARAGELVPLELSERRNLIMVNPASGHGYPTSRTAVLAYQSLLAGERARSHRHSPHAGRIVLDAGEGVYTIVNGVKVAMQPNDVVLTPGWMWHGHGNDGASSALWIDFLDIPLVQLLEPMFFEPYEAGWQEAEVETRDTTLLFPWSETRERLADAPQDRYLGTRVDLGTPALPTMALSMHRLDAGTSTRKHRTTANQQFVVVEGTGHTETPDRRVTWTRGDAFVIPCWTPFKHVTDDGAILFRVSDEPLQSYCGYLRIDEEQ